MREIKFRAWSKMYDSFYEEDIVRDYVLGDFIDDPEFVVTQYTGLKDINGTEIYEGDILLWDEAEWGCINREVVTWDYDQFYTRRNDWPQWCEVVGNVYENPELTRNRER